MILTHIFGPHSAIITDPKNIMSSTAICFMLKSVSIGKTQSVRAILGLDGN